MAIKQREIILGGNEGLIFVNEKASTSSHPVMLGQINLTGEVLEAALRGENISIALFLSDSKSDSQNIQVKDRKGNIFTVSLQVVAH